MPTIDKGSNPALATWSLIESWGKPDFPLALERCRPVVATVTWNLVFLVGLSVQTLANEAKMSFDDALSDTWLQLAYIDDKAGTAMRATVTAWSNGTEAAEAFMGSKMLDETDPDDLLMHFVAVLYELGRNLCAHTGEPIAAFLASIRETLGA
jgi:hypothetical protein